MRPIAISAEDLLRALSGKGEASQPLPEAQVMTLAETFAAYTTPCPHKPGDIVTPKPTSSYSFKGTPHVVLEVLDTPMRNFDPDSEGGIFSHSFGSRLDMRVAVLIEGRAVTFWQESWQHEPYDTKKIAEIAKAQDEGFADWTGGQRPVSENTVVSVIFRDGCRDKGPALAWSWLHDNRDHDIVRYRIEQ